MRMTEGYKLGHHACKALRAGHGRPQHSKSCVITKTIGSIAHKDTAGTNHIQFTGQLRGHALAAGAYLLSATPTLGSLTGKAISARFHII
jgi:hypothetical protein